MPRGDGTGPAGGGGGQGRGQGGVRGGGRGGRAGGSCVCPSCGEKAPHEIGVPCKSVKCPKCGTMMTRE